MTTEQAWQHLMPFAVCTTENITIDIPCLTASLSEALTTWLQGVKCEPNMLYNINIRGVEQGVKIAPFIVPCNMRCKFYNFDVQQKELTFYIHAPIDIMDIKIKGMGTVSKLCIRRKPNASVQQLYLKVNSSSLLDVETVKAKQDNDYVLAAVRLRSFWFTDKNSVRAHKLALVIHSKQFKEFGIEGKPSMQLQQLIVTHPQLIMNALQEQTLLSVANLELILDGCLSSKINLKGIKGVKNVVLPATEYLTRYKRVLCNLLQTDVQQYLPLDANWQYMGQIQLQLPDKTKTVTLTSLSYLEHFLHRLTLGDATQQVYITPASGAVPFMVMPKVMTPMLLAGGTQEVCSLCKQGIAYEGTADILHREIKIVKGR